MSSGISTKLNGEPRLPVLLACSDYWANSTLCMSKSNYFCIKYNKVEVQIENYLTRETFIEKKLKCFKVQEIC